MVRWLSFWLPIYVSKRWKNQGRQCLVVVMSTVNSTRSCRRHGNIILINLSMQYVCKIQSVTFGGWIKENHWNICTDLSTCWCGWEHHEMNYCRWWIMSLQVCVKAAVFTVAVKILLMTEKKSQQTGLNGKTMLIFFFHYQRHSDCMFGFTGYKCCVKIDCFISHQIYFWWKAPWCARGIF
jgi:hypothetical protein